MSSRPNDHKELTAERTEKAWRLRLRGFTEAKIGLELGITQQSVHSLLKKAQEKFETHFCEDIKEHKYRQLAIIETLMKEAFDSWVISKGYGATEHGIEAGDPAYLNTYRALLADARKLLGLDAPIKTESKNELTIAEYRNDIKHLLDGLTPGKPQGTT